LLNNSIPQWAKSPKKKKQSEWVRFLLIRHIVKNTVLQSLGSFTHMDILLIFEYMGFENTKHHASENGPTKPQRKQSIMIGIHAAYCSQRYHAFNPNPSLSSIYKLLSILKSETGFYFYFIIYCILNFTAYT